MKKRLSNQIEGKLVIPERMFNYCLFDTSTAYIRLHNICEILSDIYYNSEDSYLSITIDKFNKEINEYLNILNVEGELLLNKSEGVYDWFIDDVELGSVLFYNTDEKIRICIEHDMIFDD